MVARGRVQGGGVVLDNGVRLPEGQEVTVLAHATMPPAPRMEGSQPHSKLEIATVSLGSVLRPLTPTTTCSAKCSKVGHDPWPRHPPEGHASRAQ
jgi:hypothetical protein